jgi:transcriptional regulator GlxA family with amidase domain
MVTTRRLRTLCVLFPEFDTLDVTLFCSVLSLAGQRWNHRAFELSLGAMNPGEVSGRPLALNADIALSELEPVDVIFVPGGRGAGAAADDRVFVEQVARVGQGARARCAVGGGQMALARAELLAGPTCCDAETGAELLRRLPEMTNEAEREFAIRPPNYLGQRSLGVLPVALQLVADVLGTSEADHIARALGQRRRAPKLDVKH